jgi:hypothetical protein
MSTDARGKPGPVPRQIDCLAKFSRSDDRQRDTILVCTDTVWGLAGACCSVSLEILPGSSSKALKSNELQTFVKWLQLEFLTPLPTEEVWSWGGERSDAK